MAKQLRFDVSALDQASKTFLRMGQAVERFEKRLDRLDGKRVEAEVGVKTDQAEREIGRFATDTRRKLQAALSNLPEVELDANSTPLDRKLADVRRRMAELADKTIGVDLSAEEAIAEARALHTELERLGRESPNIQVQTDIAAAMAKLAEVDVATERLDGKRAEIKIDVDKSISETLIQVAQLGRALGALALPAAIVAAAPQVAALGAAALDAAGAVGLIPAVGLSAAAAIGTLVIGFQNFGDAIDTSDPAKAAEALGKLSEHARETALAARELAPAWQEVRNEVQQRLFAGVAEDVKELGGRYLPILQDGLGDVAEGLNYGAGQVAAYFRQWSTTEQVTRLVDNTSNAVENLAASLAPITAAVLDISEVSSAAFEELTRGAQDGAQSFATFIRSARDSGELRAWIDGGVAAMGRLISITGNVGSLLSSVFRAGEQASGNFLVNADRVTGVMADWASSEAGGQILVGTFRGINDTIAALLPGIRDLGLAVLNVIGMLAQSGVFTGFATALASIMSAAAPLLTVLGALASVVLPPLLSIVSALAPVLVPLAAGLLAIRAASAGLDRIRAFGGNVSAARENVVGALSPMRQLSGEMRVQSALARQAGVSHAGLRGAVAAMANSQSAAAAVVGQTGQAMAASYRQTSSAVQGFADRAGASAQRVGDALGARLAAQVSRGVESIIRIPGAVADAGRRTATAARNMGRSLSTGLQTGVIYARETLRQLPQIADRAMEQLRTSVYAGAVNASDALRTAAYDMRRSVAIAADAAADMGRRVSDGATTAVSALRALPGQVAEVGRSVGTGLRTGVSNAVSALRELPAAAADAGRSLRTGLETGVIYARETLRQLPADAANAGRSLANGLRTGVSAAGEAVRNFGTTVASGVRTAAEGVANGLRSIPDRVQGAFSSLGSAASTAIGHLGRLAGAASGTGTAIGSGLVRAGGSLVTFLGGPWGAALVVAGAALSLFGQKQADAAQKAQEHAAKIDALAQSFDKVTGSASAATREIQAQELTQVKLKDGTTSLATALGQLGISSQDWVDATTGNIPKQQQLAEKLNQVTRAAMEQHPAWANNTAEVQRWGLSIEDVVAAANGNVEAQTRLYDAAKRNAGGVLENEAANRMLVDTLIRSGGVSGEVAAQFGAAIGKYNEAKTQIDQVREATANFTDGLKTLGNEGLRVFAALAAGTPMTTEMAAALTSVGSAATTMALDVGRSTAAVSGVEQGAIAARDKMAGLRQQFIDTATAAGMPVPQAEALANSLGLIPSVVETQIRMNLSDSQAQLLQVQTMLKGLPPNTAVNVSVLSQEAIAELDRLGFKVETLPDGTFRVVPETAQANAALDEVVAKATQPATKPLLADPSDARGKDAEVRGLIQTPATKPMLADPSDVRGKDAEARGLIQAPATKPMLGDPSDAQSKDAAVRGAVQTPATKPMGGNNAAGLGAANALQVSAQAPATKPIGANDGGARGVVNSFIGWVAGLVATVKVVANKIGFEGGGIMPMETGGVIPMANGGGNGVPREWNGHRLNPMNTTARIVGPRTYRVVGDRAQGDEAYIPLVPSSGWSQTLLAVSAQRMGKEIVPAGTVARMNTVAERYRTVRAAAVEPMANGGMVTAARAILARMNARGQMFEDWTWKGAPSVVGQYNDALFDAMKRAGYRYADGRKFLEDYVRRASASAAASVTVPSVQAVRAQVQSAQAAKSAAPSVTVQTGLDIAQLKAIEAQIVGLRGDLMASAAWGPELSEHMRGLKERLLAALPATARTAVNRELSQMGGW